jgi:hypothetical protein
MSDPGAPLDDWLRPPHTGHNLGAFFWLFKAPSVLPCLAKSIYQIAFICPLSIRGFQPGLKLLKQAVTGFIVRYSLIDRVVDLQTD